MNSIKHSIKNAFTITETVIVVAVIGILMTAMTIYLDGSGERSKIIEAEGCAATLDGEIQNYMYYALTSKKLKVGENYDQEVSPTNYSIFLTGGTDHQGTSHNACGYSNYNSIDTYCDTIAFSYYTGDDIDRINRHIIDQYIYKELDSSDCRQSKSPRLLFYWSKNLNFISMNKGLSNLGFNNKRPFHLRTNSVSGDKDIATGAIIILACMGPNCEKDARKEIGKREIDARSQTIALKKCKFYQDDNPMLCETRED